MTEETLPASEGSAVVIEPGHSDARYWRDLWHYRELMYFLAWRDVKVRYKQAVLGVVWALIQPAVTMVLFTFVFFRLAKMPGGDEKSYNLLVLAGLLPWQLFASALSGAGGSVVANANLVSKVFFPRLVVPISALAVAGVDFLITLAMYAGIAVWKSEWPTWHIVFLPAFLLVALTISLGAGLWLTTLTVKYRDFRFITPFILQVGVFATPVGYRTDNLPNWHTLLSLNPLTGVINGFRWCLLPGNMQLEMPAVLLSVGAGIVLLLTGIWYFRQAERSFADKI